MRITVYIAFDKCIYNFDVVVELCLCIIFLIHKKVSIPSPCIMKHNK